MDEGSNGRGPAAEGGGDVAFGEVDVEPQHECSLLPPRKSSERIEQLVVLGDRRLGCRLRIASHDRLMAMVKRPVNIQGSRDLVMYVRGELAGQPYLVLIDKPVDA